MLGNSVQSFNITCEITALSHLKFYCKFYVISKAIKILLDLRYIENLFDDIGGPTIIILLSYEGRWKLSQFNQEKKLHLLLLRLLHRSKCLTTEVFLFHSQLSCKSEGANYFLSCYKLHNYSFNHTNTPILQWGRQ